MAVQQLSLIFLAGWAGRYYYLLSNKNRILSYNFIKTQQQQPLVEGVTIKIICCLRKKSRQKKTNHNIWNTRTTYYICFFTK